MDRLNDLTRRKLNTPLPRASIPSGWRYAVGERVLLDGTLLVEIQNRLKLGSRPVYQVKGTDPTAFWPFEVDEHRLRCLHPLERLADEAESSPPEV